MEPRAISLVEANLLLQEALSSTLLQLVASRYISSHKVLERFTLLRLWAAELVVISSYMGERDATSHIANPSLEPGKHTAKAKTRESSLLVTAISPRGLWHL